MMTLITCSEHETRFREQSHRGMRPFSLATLQHFDTVICLEFSVWEVGQVSTWKKEPYKPSLFRKQKVNATSSFFTEGDT